MATFASTGTWYFWTTTSATTATVDPWAAWTTAATGTTSVGDPWFAWNATAIAAVYPPPVFVPDRRTLLIQANRRRASEIRARVAQRRAEQLLREHLDHDQAREWDAHRHFHIETADGRRRYRIKLGLAGNIALVRDGEQGAEHSRGLRRYCMHVYPPEGRIPDEDNVLAQKLLIEADEDEFLRLANVC